MRSFIASVAAGCSLAACVATPQLELDGIAVSKVVQRIKCELAFAIEDIDIRGPYNPAKKFHWMKYWTAKVDLELQTTETGNITPSVNVFDPMTQAVLPGIGTFPRNFTFGVGGGLKTEAYRSDVLSFTLSMDELANTGSLGECNSARGLGLLGNLGLQEWVSSALVPVDKRLLTVGYHQPPTGKAVQIFGPGERAAKRTDPTPATAHEYEETIKLLIDAENLAEDARLAALEAKTFAKRKNIGRTYANARKAHDQAAAAEVALETAKARFWQQKKEKFPADKDEVKEVADRMKDAGEQISSVKQAATAAWELLPRDAPLDSITHAVKFTVTASANVNPNWTLVRFRGPGLNPPFATAQRQRVHELVIVLGSPSEPGGKGLSDEQRRQLLYQKLESFRQGGLLIVPTN